MKPIPVLWLDRNSTRSDLEFQVGPAEGTPPALAVTIGYPKPTDELAPRLMDSAKELPSSSFLLDREAVYQLHKSLGRWLQAAPMSPDDVNDFSGGTRGQFYAGDTVTVRMTPGERMIYATAFAFAWGTRYEEATNIGRVDLTKLACQSASAAAVAVTVFRRAVERLPKSDPARPFLDMLKGDVT